MTTLSSAVLKKLKRIEIKAGYTVRGNLAGEYVSIFRGSGMEFDRVREYLPGDDVRAIDWNVTARTNTPHVKVLREEREMTLMLLVDVSASVFFGTSMQEKSDVAMEFAAILGYLATKNKDRVGLIIFSDHVEHYTPPKRGRAHVWEMIRTIMTHTSRGEKTNIDAALTFLNRVCKKKAQVFLVSDFLNDGYQTSLKLARRRHRVTCVHVQDPREMDLPSVGMISFVDPESGEEMCLDTSRLSIRTQFAKAVRERQKTLETFWSKLRVDSFRVMTHEPIVTAIIQYFKRRERSLARWQR